MKGRYIIALIIILVVMSLGMIALVIEYSYTPWEGITYQCMDDTDCSPSKPICAPISRYSGGEYYGSYECVTKDELIHISKENYDRCITQSRTILYNMFEAKNIHNLGYASNSQEYDNINAIVHFHSYDKISEVQINGTDILINEYKIQLLKVVKKSFNDEYIVVLPKGKEVVTVCTLDADHRVSGVYFERQYP